MRLRAGADRRFKSGHPWVYSNELLESPKGIQPGESVTLCDASGKPLARGYGNPNSLIAFRAMSRVSTEDDPLSPEGMYQRLRRAAGLRRDLGCEEMSHRLCFGEADELPGLVIDRYSCLTDSDETATTFVLQAHTAGMDRIFSRIPELLERLCAEKIGGTSWSRAAVIARNDLSVRKLEGLPEQPPEVLRNPLNLPLENIRIQVAAPPFPGHVRDGAETIPFHVDLIHGQKTGFFLDQSANVHLLASRLSPWLRTAARSLGRPVRILDLCCYVGQWSTQLARMCRLAGVPVEITLVDASAAALEFARQNVAAQGAVCQSLKGDVLDCLGNLPDRGFDVVVSDPPAFIKGRKAIPAGTHAYLKLNTEAFRLVREGGWVTSCSCSALLGEEEFVAVLAKAARRAGRRALWVARGTQAPDHPMLAEFPEGKYLKAWIGAIPA